MMITGDKAILIIVFLRKMAILAENIICLFGLRFYILVNSYGHVVTVGKHYKSAV